MIDLDDLDPVFEQRLRASLLARADLASGVTGPDPALFRTSAPRRVKWSTPIFDQRDTLASPSRPAAVGRQTTRGLRPSSTPQLASR